MDQFLHSKILGREGFPVLILHGLLGMGDNWLSLGKKYAENGFKVHLIDQRNHGKSFHDDEMNYEVMVEDLYRYSKKHHLDHFHIIGHSMGGKTAMHFAMTHPELVDKMIVVDIAPKFYPPHHHFIFEAIEKLDLKKYRKRQEIENELAKDITSTPIRQFILKNLARDKNGLFYWKPNIPVLKNSLHDLGQALPPLQSIRTKTLFVKGEKSPYILPEDLPGIKAHFPHSDTIIIPNSSHWVHAQQPLLFWQASLNFLNKNH